MSSGYGHMVGVGVDIHSFDTPSKTHTHTDEYGYIGGYSVSTTFDIHMFD